MDYCAWVEEQRGKTPTVTDVGKHPRRDGDRSDDVDAQRDGA